MDRGERGLHRFLGHLLVVVGLDFMAENKRETEGEVVAGFAPSFSRTWRAENL
jgi:hypothetical protein